MKKQWVADGSLLFVAFVWGATFVVVQNAISFLPPLSFNAVRFWLAGIFLLAWIYLFHRPLLRSIDRSALIAGGWMGVWLFSGYALQTIGLLYTTSANAGFITGLNVVIVPFLAFLFLKQKPTANAVVGAMMATVGLYFLTMNGGEWSINRGDLFVFFCAISFAFHIVITGKYAAHHSTLLLTAIQIFAVAILCTVFAFMLEDGTAMWNWAILQEPNVWTALLVTSLLATVAAFLIQTNFQKYTTPSRVALIFAMEPVFAATTAYVWADERLSMFDLIGCCAILVGMIFSELPIALWLEKRRKSELTM